MVLQAFTFSASDTRSDPGTNRYAPNRLSRRQFDQLAMEQCDTLFRVARRLTGDSGRAEDLVQETFARALRGFETFSPREYGIKPWLVRIMRNLHITLAIRESRRPAAVSDESLEISALGPESDLPIDLDSFQLMDERLVHALDDLPEVHRAALVLWAIEDLSYKEIAKALAVPLGTVMSRLHRARQGMKERLKDHP